MRKLLLGLILAAAVSTALAKKKEPPPPPLPPPPMTDGVRLLSRTERDYAALELAGAPVVAPDAVARLVVLRAGDVVLDRGLRRDSRRIGQPGQDPDAEEGVAETAELAPDGSFALVVSTTYRKSLRKPEPGMDSEMRGTTEITWIDPKHPQGLWSVPLEEGRWVKQALPLSATHGVAVATCPDSTGKSADLRVFSPEGMEMLRLRETDGSVLRLAATAQGEFLAADVMYPERRGLPARGIIVFDIAQGTRWTYVWSYGTDAEPTDWKLADGGVLELTLPDALRAYDRTGKPIRMTRRK